MSVFNVKSFSDRIVADPKFKSSLCSNNPTCWHGSKCTFAHGELELYSVAKHRAEKMIVAIENENKIAAAKLTATAKSATTSSSMSPMCNKWDANKSAMKEKELEDKIKTLQCELQESKIFMESKTMALEHELQQKNDQIAKIKALVN